MTMLECFNSRHVNIHINPYFFCLWFPCNIFLTCLRYTWSIPGKLYKLNSILCNYREKIVTPIASKLQIFLNIKVCGNKSKTTLNCGSDAIRVSLLHWKCISMCRYIKQKLRFRHKFIYTHYVTQCVLCGGHSRVYYNTCMYYGPMYTHCTILCSVKSCLQQPPSCMKSHAVFWVKFPLIWNLYTAITFRITSNHLIS